MAETDRLKTELLEQTRAQVAAAEDLAQLRSSFVAAVSHELRSPLTAIVGYAELLRAHWVKLADADRLERIGRIVDAANRQKYLVEQLLTMSRMEMTTPTPATEPLNLPNLIQRAADEVRTGYRGQQIRLEGSPDLDVLADPERTLQILVNLLDNAAKYSPDGASIEVIWCEEGAQAIVRVRDHGTGVPAEGRERLFTRFGRVPGSRIRAGHVGTGLGLYLGRNFAQAMHGDLSLEDTGPSGSVFSLQLPLVRPLSNGKVAF
jgi:signal transduction histidine kinase